jgi:hypothetical protein
MALNISIGRLTMTSSDTSRGGVGWGVGWGGGELYSIIIISSLYIRTLKTSEVSRSHQTSPHPPTMDRADVYRKSKS